MFIYNTKSDKLYPISENHQFINNVTSFCLNKGALVISADSNLYYTDANPDNFKDFEIYNIGKNIKKMIIKEKWFIILSNKNIIVYNLVSADISKIKVNKPIKFKLPCEIIDIDVYTDNTFHICII